MLRRIDSHPRLPALFEQFVIDSAADGTHDDDLRPPAVEPGQELRRLRRQRGVSLAGLAQRIHYTKGYLSRVESGDKPLTLAVAEACDAALESDGLLGRLASAALPAQRRRGDPSECPYRGLSSYDTADSGWFFGRERATAALVQVVTARLGGAGPVMVVAASGAGKSSLLRAGLVPALYRGALPVRGSHRWPVLTMRPGERPVEHLLALLSRAAGLTPEALRRALEQDPHDLVRLLQGSFGQEGRAAGEEDRRVVLIVDQFEEVFTLCEDPGRRALFIRVLHALSTLPGGTPGGGGPEGPAAVVVLGMRADFYGSALAHPELAEALRNGQLPLEPMSPGEIRAAVVKPAEAAGLELEPGLVEVILRDLGAVTTVHDPATEDGAPGAKGGPGMLPLLSHALLTTWQERDGTRLTLAGYEQAGGIVRAVSATAEHAYGQLSDDRKETARTVLLCLVRVDEDGRVTRRHASREELTRGTGGRADEIVEEFTRARLLTADRGAVTFAHEVVLRAWPRLRNWIDTDTAALRARHRLREAARQWQAEDHDPALLPRGSRLAAAQEAAGHLMADVGEGERAFLRAALAREREERESERRRTRRLRHMVTALAVLLAVAVVSTVTAVHSSREASAGERMAHLNQKLALLGISTIDGNSEAAMLLAASAWSAARTETSADALLSLQTEPYAGALKGPGHIRDPSGTPPSSTTDPSCRWRRTARSAGGASTPGRSCAGSVVPSGHRPLHVEDVAALHLLRTGLPVGTPGPADRPVPGHPRRQRPRSEARAQGLPMSPRHGEQR